MMDEFHNTLVSQIGGDTDEDDSDEILNESFDELEDKKNNSNEDDKGFEDNDSM